MAKDRGMGNVIKAQILLYPTLLAVSGYPSYELYGKGNYVLSSQDSLNFAEAYMPTEVSDLPHHYAKPLTATTEQLQGLPPALVLTCQCDVLRDEGEAYDTKLLEAGVDVVGIRMLGATHAFMSGFPVETSIYKQGLNNVIGFVKEKLNY
jgi:acetyl esterase